MNDTNSLSDLPSRRFARIENIVFDHLQRRLVGEDVRDETLVALHPDLMPELGEQLRLLGDLQDPAHRGGAPATVTGASRAEGTRALRVRCPFCHQPVDVSVDSSLMDIACGSCGSHFSLLDDAAETREVETVRQIGHFELIQRLGAGSFGTVWQARDMELDRTVAIKIPRREKLDHNEVEQFLREARAAAQLNHPNIVSVHEVGREAETVFIVSDLVRGVSLSDWLSGKSPTYRQAATLCKKVADALEHAHQSGVVHRDLKPQNIIMDADDEPHMTDFGLARRDAGEVTVTLDGFVLGTPAYMSPEQARGEAHRAEGRTDIYSLGVILFELLTGELPFKGTTRMLLHQVVYDDAPRARKIKADIPKDLETICRKCMEKEPERRYASAREVAEDLRRYLSDEPIQARPTRLPERMWRVCRRNPVQTGLATTVAILVLTLATVWLISPAPAQPVALDSLAVVLDKVDESSGYLRDELSRNLIRRFSQFSALDVKSRSATLRHQNKPRPDAARLGQQLGVKAILTGEVRFIKDDNLQVELQLRRVKDGQTIWSKESPIHKEELLGFASGVVRSVIKNLAIGLTLDENQQLAQSSAQNQAALYPYLRGRELFNRFTEPAIKDAASEFQRAIELSPGFAEAHVGLAACYLGLGYQFLDPKNWLEKAEVQVTKALQLDESIVEARVIQGSLQYYLHWQWAEADRVLKEAIDLDASLVETNTCYLHAMASLGKPDRGVQAVQSALMKQPDSLAIRWELGCAMYYARRYKESLVAYEEVRKYDPDNSFYHWGVGRAHNQLRNHQEAIKVLEQGMAKVGGQWSGLLAELAYGYAKNGQVDLAHRILRDLQRRASEGEYIDPFIFAMIHVGLGDIDETFRQLDKAAEVKSTWLPSLNTAPKFDGMREDPRMQELVQRLGFEPELEAFRAR